MTEEQFEQMMNRLKSIDTGIWIIMLGVVLMMTLTTCGMALK